MIKHKTKLPRSFVKVRGLLIRLIILSIIIFSALFFVIGHLKANLVGLDYFKIKDVVVSEPESGFDFSYLKGRNIFDVNLTKESRYIAESYPAYRKVGLIRILPNCLYVGFATRKPLAYVKLYRYFCIDEDMVLFDVAKGLEESNLPIILGLETKISSPKLGKQYKVQELRVALDIIKKTKMDSLLKDYRIKKIDLTNPAGTSFLILIPSILSDYPKVFTKVQAESAGIEVRISQDNINDKMHILAGIFMQLKNDLNKIKYIDLRFKEPVIKFK